MEYSKVAVFGAGAMGTGIAQALAAASMEVVLMDVTMALVEKALERIDARCASDVKKGRLRPEEKDRLMGRIKGGVSHEGVSDADLMIEAVVEDRKIKGDLFAALGRIAAPEVGFATNTSTLSVTELGALSERPSRFVGLHFFNPVHAMKLVEVVPGLDTDRHVIDSAFALVKSLKKVPVVVQDCPGFLVNRILLTYVGEALLCAQEGVSPEEIDTQAKRAGFPMGPLELSDMVGWDVSLRTFPVLHEGYGVRFPFPGIVQKLNEAGRLGLKTGKGVYCEGRVDDEFRAMVASMGLTRENAGFSIERLILRQVNEAIYCLQEGVASAEAIDRAMVLGTGFPSEGGIGGPLHWADDKGLDWVLATLEELRESEGDRFHPHHLLKTYVAAGRLGKKRRSGFFEY
ncbi:MAG: 3-hydroxyacyl-CoA dehydrogenase [Deltaproteobacteria bacterium]|nr:3-hydroxyacyl-CoA dehydrogenase [Deltaproteobacteria bacterium]